MCTSTSSKSLSFYSSADSNRSAQQATPASPSTLWHSRFGHPGPDLYNKLVSQIPKLPSMKPDQVTICPTCAISKSVIRKGKLSTTEYTQPLQLIQVDLCGPFHYNNFVSKHYFMIIRDAYSRYYSC